MLRFSTTLIARRLSALRPADDDGVHFHLGRDGEAFICDHHRCDSAALTLSEVGNAARA